MLKHNVMATVLGGALLLAGTAAAHAETYTLDPMHTAVAWRINHFGFSNPSGKFMHIDGTLQFDAKNPTATKVNVTIPVGDIDTDIPALNEHLLGSAFFDVAKYPTATYVSTSVDMTGKDTALMHGKLTVHGVTKPVDLHVKINKIGINMMGRETVGITATTHLKRSDFGMTAYLPGLSDNVDLIIDSEANAKK